MCDATSHLNLRPEWYLSSSLFASNASKLQQNNSIRLLSEKCFYHYQWITNCHWFWFKLIKFWWIKDKNYNYRNYSTNTPNVCLLFGMDGTLRWCVLICTNTLSTIYLLKHTHTWLANYIEKLSKAKAFIKRMPILDFISPTPNTYSRGFHCSGVGCPKNVNLRNFFVTSDTS